MALKKKIERNRKFVEIGRVVLILFGKHRNTLAVITDVIDQNWVLADGRCVRQLHGAKAMKRQAINIKNIRLTHMMVKMHHGLNTRSLRKLCDEAKIMEQWKVTDLYKKIAKKHHKLFSTDLERWRVAYNRKERSPLIKMRFKNMRKRALVTAAQKYTSKQKLVSKTNKVKKMPKLLKKQKPYLLQVDKLKLNLRALSHKSCAF
eukprot:NODE_6882_length_810_cov_805.490539_g6646_i0.p1 GENE.NODE_6882_length_810_cov_805.490539_g6646_i0~~NODE_6882_length_810_cov_805.490539_g6646_i0.p1  ORF type:complete len:204 (+),score=59.94 NODE_6882_length_810_cov_805.490539_g6646_i0:60-671(+)